MGNDVGKSTEHAEGYRMPEVYVKMITLLYKASATARGIEPNKFIELFKTKSDLTKEQTQFLTSIFNAFDDNNDVYLDLTELLEMFDIALCGSANEKAHGIFRMCDYNHDGYITQDELRRFMKSMTWAHGKSKNELLQEADSMFTKFNTDGDSVLNLTEFIQGYKNNPEMMKLVEDSVALCMGIWK